MALRLRCALLVCWGLFSFTSADEARAQSAAGCVAQMDAQVTGFENFASTKSSQAAGDIQAAFAAGDAAGAYAISANAQKSIVNAAGQTVREVVRISSVCIRQMRRTRNTREIATVAAGMQQAVSDVGTAQATAISQLEDTTLGTPGTAPPIAQQLADKYITALGTRSARFDAAAGSYVARAVSMISQHTALGDDGGAARLCASSQSILARSAGIAISGCDRINSSGARALARYPNTAQLIASLQSARDTAVGDIQATLNQGNADIGAACGDSQLPVSISIVKSVNGQDANAPPGPSVNVGDQVTFTFVVTNDGQAPLTNVSVTDDQLGPITNITDQGDGDTTLDVNESWTYEETTTATAAGQFTNTATVTASGPQGQTTTDTDVANHEVMDIVIPPDGITIVSVTIGGQDCATPPGPNLTEGNAAMLQVTVTPISGSSALNNVQVSGLTFVSGDTDSDNELEQGESWTYERTEMIAAGTQQTAVTATASPVGGGTQVTDVAMCNYVGIPDTTGNLGTVDLANHEPFDATFTISSATYPQIQFVDPTSGNPLGNSVTLGRRRGCCAETTLRFHVDIGQNATLTDVMFSVVDTRMNPPTTGPSGGCVIDSGIQAGEVHTNVDYNNPNGNDGTITCQPDQPI